MTPTKTAPKPSKSLRDPKQLEDLNSNRQYLAASISPETLNAQERTVDCVWFTGIDVQRYDWLRGEDYILRFDLGGADLSLLNNGAPVFDNHASWGGASDQKGVVQRAWRDGNEFKATLRFSKRAEVDGLWQDIADKIVQKFSMGVELQKKKTTERDGDKLRVDLVTKWRPFEISTAPLPADNNTRTLDQTGSEDSSRATSPKESASMAEEATTGVVVEQAREESKPTEARAADEQLNSARQVGATAEKARVQIILEINSKLKLPFSFGMTHINENTSVETFRNLAIDKAAELNAQIGVTRTAHSDILRDEQDTKRRAMIGALLNRQFPGWFEYSEKRSDFALSKTKDAELYDPSRRYLSYRVMDMARECLSAIGMDWRGVSNPEIARLAFSTTSDFPFILEAVTGKSLRAGYEMYTSEWRNFCARRSASDFNQKKELTLDSKTRLQQVNEHGEIQTGALIEGKETWQILTYAEIIAITRQAIVNDDLGAFTRVPQLLGQEVAMMEADKVYAVITANAVLRDGIPLFDAGHGNLTTPGGTISIDELGVTRALMMLQKSTGGKPLNIVPRYLVVPVALGQLAVQYTSVNYQAAQPSAINPSAGRLTPIIDSRLDANSATAWYLFADPVSPNGTVIIYAFLEGQEAPFTETQMGFEIDGLKVKIRHDFGTGAVDFRGAVKNDGTP